MAKRRGAAKPVELTWRSGPPFVLGAEPPSRYKTVTDFEIVITEGYLGLEMAWRSPSLGLLTWFPWSPLTPAWRFEDEGPTIAEGGRPLTRDSGAFIAIDQGYLVEVWDDGRFVHVEHGTEGEQLVVHTWYRVPRAVFDAAWDGFVGQLEEATRRRPNGRRSA